MSLDKLKPEAQRALAVGVPVVVALFAATLVAPKLMGIWSARRQVAARRAEVALRQQENQAELAAESQKRLPASPETRDETLIFLRELNRMIALSSVHLVSYRPPAGTASGAPGAGLAAGGGPVAGRGGLVKPVATEITVSGAFSDLVTLFRTLASGQRLYTVDNLQVRTDSYPRLTAVFRLTRYVTPLSVAAAPARAAAAVRVASAGTPSWPQPARPAGPALWQ